MGLWFVAIVAKPSGRAIRTIIPANIPLMPLPDARKWCDRTSESVALNQHTAAERPAGSQADRPSIGEPTTAAMGQAISVTTVKTAQALSRLGARRAGFAAVMAGIVSLTCFASFSPQLIRRAGIVTPLVGRRVGGSLLLA